jgi:hypothetical protein
VFLYRTLPAQKLDFEVNIKDDITGRPAFEVMYENPDTTFKRLVSIFNSIFTQRMQTFMLSRNSAIKLIKEDPNHELSLSPNEYNHFLKIITQGGYFQVLKTHTKKKAGVYKLVHPELVKELRNLAAKEYFEAQEQAVLAYYDKDLESKKTKPLSGKELADKIREDMKNKGLKYEQ